MSVHASTGSRRKPSAANHALLVFLIALTITGAGWAWALLAAPGTVRAPVGWGGGAAAVVIVAAVTAAVYFAETARRSRGLISAADAEAEQLKRELARLAEETLPLLVQRVRAGAAAGTVLAGIPDLANGGAVRDFLDAVLHEVAVAERRAAVAQADRTGLEEEVDRLAGETLPIVLGRVRDGVPADTVLAEAPDPAGGALRDLRDTVVREVAVAERRGDAAMAACASAAARIQAQTTRMLAELREMENRYGDDKVFGDLMELDHRVSQMGRLSDSIALLAGGRSGRRWTKPIPMESILRGAMGRIDAYQRVRLHSTSNAAIVGYAAEGVMHALAELMDNAAAFSAHGSEVHVYVEDEDVGAVVTIEDSGLGMRKRERSRAEELVSQPLSLATLQGTRLGLAVVGRLASRYGLSVNFRPSSRGGTGVVVMVPRQLIAQPKLYADVPYVPAGDSGDSGGPVSVSQEAGAANGGPGQLDLPKRPRGVTLAEATRSAPEPAAASAAPPRDAAARFAAFRQAGERNRGAPGGPEDETA
jgi:signal transduction histidine kinase